MAGWMGVVVLGGLLTGNAGGPASRHVSRLFTGALVVVSERPGASVKVDGDVRGRTPVRVAGLQTGLHRVEVAGSALEVPVQEGVLTTLSAGALGINVSHTPQSATALPQRATPPQGSGRPAPAWDGKVLRSIISQPWGYAGAAFTGLALVGAGVLWTASPGRFPVLGTLPLHVDPLAYRVMQVGSVALVAAGGLATVFLFVAPQIPWPGLAGER